jgi:hypothetical protein
MKEHKMANSGRNLKAEDSYGLGKLGFTTAMGLAAFVAAEFTTMLPLSFAWRYFWLAVCVVSFLLAVIGVALFFQRPDELKAAPPLPRGGSES